MMSGPDSEWTEEEIAKWESGEWLPADDEAHKARLGLERQRGDRGAKHDKDLRFVLPERWKVVLERKPGEQHRAKDFSDIQRVCNRKLKRLYNEWQEEVEKLGAEHTAKLEAISAATSVGSAGQALLQQQLLQKDTELKELTAQLEAAQATAATAGAECEKKLEEMGKQHEQAMAELKAEHQRVTTEGASRLMTQEVAHRAELEKARASARVECQKELEEIGKQYKQAMDEVKAEHQRVSMEGASKLMTQEVAHRAELEKIQMEAEAKVLKEQEENRVSTKKHGIFKARIQHALGKWQKKVETLRQRLLAKSLRIAALEVKSLPQDPVAKHPGSVYDWRWCWCCVWHLKRHL